MDSTLTLQVRLIILVVTLFAWLAMYFFVNRRQVDPEDRRSYATPLDGKIPFVPQLALIYFSTYVFVVEPFLILSNARQFTWMLVSFAAISVTASLIHAFHPSRIERREDLQIDGPSAWMIRLFQRTCKPYGNFPSMHVALSVPVVGANYLAAGPLMGSFTLVWAALIALSTLYTKQHYILDVLAGIALGVLVFAGAAWVIPG